MVASEIHLGIFTQLESSSMPDALSDELVDLSQVEVYADDFAKPEFGEDLPLYSEKDVTRIGVDAVNALQIKNVIVGYKAFNLKGPRWHNFRFGLRSAVAVNKAVVSVALLGIYNRNTAVNLEYSVQNVSTSYSQDRKTIYVSGRVYVGDSDGYLRQLSYHCVAI